MWKIIAIVQYKNTPASESLTYYADVTRTTADTCDENIFNNIQLMHLSRSTRLLLPWSTLAWSILTKLVARWGRSPQTRASLLWVALSRAKLGDRFYIITHSTYSGSLWRRIFPQCLLHCYWLGCTGIPLRPKSGHFPKSDQISADLAWYVKMGYVLPDQVLRLIFPKYCSKLIKGIQNEHML